MKFPDLLTLLHHVGINIVSRDFQEVFRSFSAMARRTKFAAQFSSTRAKKEDSRKNGVVDHQDHISGLTGVFEGLSVAPLHAKEITVPNISAFIYKRKAVAGCRVTVGEAVPKAESIPDNYNSTWDYLKVQTNSVTTIDSID